MMNSAQPITVLMPVYNGADYLAESIETILGQTFREFEFLIINDGSRDGSQAILETYAARDPRIRLLQQENMGLAATLNKGLGLARGALVARQDQDDLSSPERLARQLAYMQAHEDCVLLGTRAAILADRTPTQRAHDHPVFNTVLKLDLLFNNPFVHSSVMLRRDRVLELGGYTTDRNRQPPEDYELWARIGRAGRVANLPERLLVYREAAQSMSRTGHNPFQSKLVLLCAENLALTSGLSAPDRHCRDIAALMHQAPLEPSESPDLPAMEAVLQRCIDRIAPEAQSGDEAREFRQRCGYWMDNLRHHHRIRTPRYRAPAEAARWRARPFTGKLPETPAVTVLMPVYNGAAQVADAIESILGQTLSEFEFLIVNDGSQDRTQSILDDYAARDARIRVVQQANMGLAGSLNVGLALAKGEFVARQDHDDLSAPDRLEKQLAWMQAHPDCALLGTRAVITADGEATSRCHDHALSNAALQVDLLFDNPFVHSSVMLRRQSVLALGGYSTDPTRQPPEDYELWARIGRAAAVANLPERLLVYNEVQGSMSRSGEHPFRSRLVRLSSENLAFASGLSAADTHCVDIAALVHRQPQALSSNPDLRAMQAVLRRAFQGIAPAIASDEERREFEARCRFWVGTLRRHYLHRVLPPAWMQPLAAAGYRRARSLLRTVRSLARRVVG
jgi:glycosyltransferase involved in cell wall biosynthesis